MGKPMDPNLNAAEGDVDPFGGDSAPGGDPFDFSDVPPTPAPRSEAPPKGIKPPKRPAPAPSASLSPQAPSTAEPRSIGMTADVPVQMVAVLGKKAATVKEIIALKKGQIVELNRFPNEAIDLVANGKLVAKGELVEIDGKLGVRIIKIFE